MTRVLSGRGSAWRIGSVSIRMLMVVGCVAAMGFGWTQESGDPPAGAVEQVAGNDGPKLREAFLVRIPLPLTGDADERVKGMIKRVLERLEVAADASKRPVLVLEFDTTRGASGRGSQLERCVSLARFLTSEQLNRVQTVAYVTGGKTGDVESPPLSGHALLVALACEQWYLQSEARIGSAGLDELRVDPFVMAAYQSIAASRQTLPEAFVLGLVDPNQGIYRVEEVDGSLRFVNQSDLLRLESDGGLAQSETLLEAGEQPDFSGDLLYRYQLIQPTVRDRMELAARLKIRSEDLEGDPSLSGQWQAIQIRLHGPIDQRQINWVLSSLQTQRDRGVSLVVVDLNSQGGSFRDATRLAQQLADLDPLEVRTVAYVSGQVAGPAALIAGACDHLVFEEGATLGGEALPALDDDSLADLAVVVPDIASQVGRDSSLITALVNPNLQLAQYRKIETGELRLWTPEAWEANEFSSDWVKVSEVDTSQGLSANEANRLMVARYVVADQDELRALYQLNEPPELLEPTATFRGIDRFARFLASPWISWWLLFGGMIFLSSELSSPGLSAPGFMSALCFLLFFWSQYLDGNAHWLELLLFVAGVISLLIEVFIVPGFGLFGIGGILMMLVSVVLATQTFVFPTTSEELAHVPVTLAMVLALVLGVAIPMMVIPKYIDRMPLLRRLSLNPRADEDAAGFDVEGSSASLGFLEGKSGQAVTALVPGGKVRFGDDVYSVVTDGRLVNRGEHVVVRQVRGNHILVEPLDLSGPSSV